MTTEVASRVEYALSLANEHSKREGRWSLASELVPFLETEYSYSNVNVVNVYNQLVMLEKDKQVEKKLKSAPWTSQLWRVVSGSSVAGNGSGPMDAYRSPDPWQSPDRPYVKPEDDDRPDGEWNNWGKPRGEPIIAPVPVIVPDISSGIVRGTIQNLM